jgi:hypothetical protein
MEKTSKITRTVFKNEWTGQNGVVFYHEIELENGDKGQIGCKDKEPSWLNPCQELTYTIEVTDKGNKIKRVNAKPSYNGGGGKSGSPASFALSYAKDVVIASWGEHAPKKMASEDLFKIADKMYEWMKGKQ